MSRSCIVQEFPIPQREYYAAAPFQWDEPAVSRPRHPAPSRLKRRRKKRARLLPLALAGLALFVCGFLLGRVQAAGAEPSPSEGTPSQQFFPLPEEPEAKGEDPIRVQAVPGGVRTTTDNAAEEDWRLILVNWEHPLPEDFQVPKLTQLKNGHAVDSRAYPELQRMMDDCRAAGLDPLICSSYRSWDKQAELFENKVTSCLSSAGSRKQAEEQAAEWVSRPGASEHQAGLALDIVDKSYQLLDKKQEDTQVQKWLMAHCAEYGFILRYPTEKSHLTGVNYEPWHYRYVGVDAAREIMNGGLCLEEYLEKNW